MGLLLHVWKLHMFTPSSMVKNNYLDFNLLSKFKHKRAIPVDHVVMPYVYAVQLICIHQFLMVRDSSIGIMCKA